MRADGFAIGSQAGRYGSASFFSRSCSGIRIGCSCSPNDIQHLGLLFLFHYPKVGLSCCEAWLSLESDGDHEK
jgi:hypothetical protein